MHLTESNDISSLPIYTCWAKDRNILDLDGIITASPVVKAFLGYLQGQSVTSMSGFGYGNNLSAQERMRVDPHGSPGMQHGQMAKSSPTSRNYSTFISGKEKGLFSSSLFSDVFLQLLEDRGAQTALLQDKEVHKAAALPCVCVPRTGPCSASVAPSGDVASPESWRV